MPARDTSRMSRALTMLIAAAILGLTLLPPMRFPLQDFALLQSDRFHHIAAFALLILPAALLDPRGMRWILPASLALGCVIEFIQPVFGRTASGYDFLADMLGLAIGATLGLALRRFRTWSPA